TTWPLVWRKCRANLILPSLQSLSGTWRLIASSKECHTLRIKASPLDQQLFQVGLRFQGFSEDHDAPATFRPSVNDPHYFKQLIRFAVLWQGLSTLNEIKDALKLGLHRASLRRLSCFSFSFRFDFQIVII